MPSVKRVALGALFLLLSPAACGGGDDGSSGAVSADAEVESSVDAPEDTEFNLPDSATADVAFDTACKGVSCPSDQHCDPSTSACVANTCEMLGCAGTTVCEKTDAGAICKDISCTTDADCPSAKFCNGTICVDDTCVPGFHACAGDVLRECASNGSAMITKYTCGSTAAFVSKCVDAGDGRAGCTCEGDWDCPANTTCEAGKCSGTGVAPTCTLPPVAFSSVLPVAEFHWGGLGQTAKDAVGAPFPLSSQSSVTPLVANLDDDNGDGKIDERDFPEIIFMTYCGTDIATNGIVRAVHGGGANKGKDFFATCGATTWHEGDPLTMACPCVNATGNSTAIPAVGDLDGDGVPEIVVPNELDGLTILDNKGNTISSSANAQWPGAWVNPAIAIANLDGVGNAEIVVGNLVFTVGKDTTGKLVFVDRFAGALMAGMNGQGPISCVADVAGDSRLEIAAGTTLYRMPSPPAGVTKRAECAVGAMDDFCTGKLTVVWDAQTVNGTTAIPAAQRDGFCAIADVLGTNEATAPSPTNALDGKAEVIVVAEGHLVVLNGATGALRRFTNLGAGTDGGAPNVDDFDGDGFPEIGTAFGTAYIVIDLQEPTTACPAWPNVFNDAVAGLQGNPARSPGGACTKDSDCAAGAVCNTTIGACTCLHNGWRRLTEDDSSRVTGSSVFDFNGDGAAEVVYNDECYLRVYDGRTGAVQFKTPSVSRTRVENPAIADVDNDGNAEIIVTSNNDANSCSTGNNYPNGLTVYGDKSDTWVSARRVWNQHAYHVTNVTESGGIPLKEPKGWLSYGGRKYNTFRSQPRNYAVAPDLVAKAIQVSSPDATCGTLSKKLDITVQVDNAGDLRVGPGVQLGFYGTWTSPALTEALNAPGPVPLRATITSSLEPGASLLVTVHYDAADNAPGVVPDEVRVVVDDANIERECKETNNELTKKVSGGSLAADLRVALGAFDSTKCPTPTVVTTVTNAGSAPASGVVVRYYAGDPSAGGTPFHDETIAGPIAPGASVTSTPTLTGMPTGASIVLWAVVDPGGAIPECNDGDNAGATAMAVGCSSIK